MRKVLRHKVLIMTGLLALGLTVFSFVTINKTNSGCMEATPTCCKHEPASKSDMFWDAIPRQFVSAILIR